ncbi:hypothetical protein DsansV1_C38g0233021 [Dioscorea sansibarensis]
MDQINTTAFGSPFDSTGHEALHKFIALVHGKIFKLGVEINQPMQPLACVTRFLVYDPPPVHIAGVGIGVV